MRQTISLALLCVLLLAGNLCAQTFDFTRADDCKGWQPTHDVSSLEPSAEGLSMTISGGDPYINGPARDYPAGQLLWMTMKRRPRLYRGQVKTGWLT